MTKEVQLSPRRKKFSPIRISRDLSEAAYRAAWIEGIKGRTVIDERGCWVWQGFCGHKGYGMVSYRDRRVIALHRAMYMAWHGISELQFEQQVCHSCDNRRCCNPDHLWLGDNSQNMRDMVAKGRNYWKERTHCKQGHEYTPENTRWVGPPHLRKRQCKACGREAQHRRWRKRKAA